jgi:site-specific DNA-methyltransferase (adenine-specific)
VADYLLLQSDARRISLPDRSVDLVLGSPPYIDARLYLEDGKDLGIARDCAAWIEWMLGITAESLRVSRGLVLWVVAGVTRGRNYQPGPEGLLYRWWAQGGDCHCLRPVIWHRYGISGSGSNQWFRADTEYVLAFKRPGPLPWADNTANGQPPMFKPGGRATNRMRNGKRINENYYRAGHMTSVATVQDYVPPDIANPGNFLHTNTGGGQLGSPHAHDNEAPYPIDVPKWFIASHCQPGGLVLDPFSGSGTTADAAISLGRRAIGLDIRRSQCELGRRRIAGSLRPVSRYDPPPPLTPLPGQGDLFSYLQDQS